MIQNNEASFNRNFVFNNFEEKCPLYADFVTVLIPGIHIVKEK